MKQRQQSLLKVAEEVWPSDGQLGASPGWLAVPLVPRLAAAGERGRSAALDTAAASTVASAMRGGEWNPFKSKIGRAVHAQGWGALV